MIYKIKNWIENGIENWKKARKAKKKEKVVTAFYKETRERREKEKVLGHPVPTISIYYRVSERLYNKLKKKGKSVDHDVIDVNRKMITFHRAFAQVELRTDTIPAWVTDVKPAFYVFDMEISDSGYHVKWDLTNRFLAYDGVESKYHAPLVFSKEIKTIDDVKKVFGSVRLYTRRDEREELGH